MPESAVNIAIDDSKGRSKKAKIKMAIPVMIKIICTIGNPGSFKTLFPDILNLKIPKTASIGNIPKENPIYTKICSKVPDKTKMIAIELCRIIAPIGTLYFG